MYATCVHANGAGSCPAPVARRTCPTSTSRPTPDDNKSAHTKSPERAHEITATPTSPPTACKPPGPARTAPGTGRAPTSPHVHHEHVPPHAAHAAKVSAPRQHRARTKRKRQDNLQIRPPPSRLSACKPACRTPARRPGMVHPTSWQSLGVEPRPKRVPLY